MAREKHRQVPRSKNDKKGCMAGDWIKMRNNLWDDPRVSSICDLTSSSEATVIGALYWLWASADEHTENGFLPGLTVSSINRKTGVQGFGEALLSIGWLAQEPDGLTIRHFEEHNGTSAKRRCMEAQRKANVRTRSGQTADKMRTDGGQNAPFCGAREEKRREEYSDTDVSGGKPPLAPSEIIFGYGLPLLTNAGTPEKQARSFLGGLRKSHGDDALIDKLRDCLKAKPLQPLEWLAAALPPTGPPNRQEALEKRNRSIADRWAAKESNAPV